MCKTNKEVFMELIDKKILKIHNYIYANDGLSNSETLNEFLKLFYCKILDEQNSNILENCKSNDDLLKNINSLFEKLKEKLSDFFDKDEKINLKSETILYTLTELRGISFNSISSDTKGHILQKIIDRSYRESRGQFFTPSPVVDFIVKMINPKNTEKGCDPACGTGGFMFKALEHISMQGEFSKDLLNNFYFYDISKSLIKLIAMRMMFEFSESNVNFKVRDSILENYAESFDYVLTNPPFGSQGKIQNKNILKNYDLGHDENGKLLNAQVPDILFVEKIIKILNENGRAAIVLPDGDFENPSLDYFRKYIIENVKIDAIVSLPDGTFIPYGTGVQSSIIFISKLPQTELQKQLKNNYKIFYGKITKLGYTFSKHSKDVFDENGNLDEDYSDILNCYKNHIYNDNAYLVSVQDVISNKYNLSESLYSPIFARVQNKIKQGNFAYLKDLVQFNYKKEKIQNDKNYNYIEIADVNAYTSEIINSTTMQGEDLPSRASYILEKDDLIVATSGGSIGTKKQSKALVSDIYANSICTNGFTVMKATKISPYYLLNFFNKDEFLFQVLKYKYGTAIPCIGREDFENILVPIPTSEELTEIENRIKKALELRAESNRLMLA